MSLLTPHQQKLKQRRPHSNTVSGADRPPAIDTIITSGISHRRNSEGSPRALEPPPINVSAPSPTAPTHQQQHLDSPKTLSLQRHFPDTVMPSSSDDDNNNNHTNNSSRAATPPVATVPETKPGTMSRLFAGHKKSRSRGSSLSTQSINDLPDTHAEKQQALGNSKLRSETMAQQQQPQQPHRGSDDASSEMSFAAGSIAAACNVEPANAKRNQDFHALFRSVPEDDPLIEDFGCALQKEILLQGRIYISESHLCFNANIFGWVTNLVIAFSDIVDIEKRTTALFIPNAIQVSTLHAKHFFASFLSRDQAYDLIVDVWRMSRPSAKQNIIDDDENKHVDENDDDEEITSSDDSSYTYGSDDESSISEPEDEAQDRQGSLASLPLPETNKDEEAARRRAISEAGPRPNVKSLATQQQQQSPLPGSNDTQDSNNTNNNANGNGNNANKPVQKQEKTECNCLKCGEHYPKVVQDQTFNCTIETMYNLLYNSDFIKKFLTDQKCTDLTINSWHDSDAENIISSREMSYIKPLNGSIGPKSTKCLLTEDILHRDLEDFVTQVTTTQTPDVPSGGSFSVKTRTCLMWAGKGQVRMLVTVLVDFTKSSWLKSTIESASISGQEGYYKELDAAIRHHLGKPAAAAAAATSGSHGKKTDKRKKKVKRKHKNKEGQKSGGDNKPTGQNDDQSPWQRLLSSSIDWIVSNATLPTASQISVLCMFMLVLINLYIANKMAQMDRQLEAIHLGAGTSSGRKESPVVASPQADHHHEIENELWDWLGQLDPEHKVKTATVQDPSAAWESMTTEDDNASWDARLRESQLSKDKLDQHMADLEKMIQRASNNMQEVTKVVERQRSRIVENWAS
ncbi:hypothetical protein BDB00DRAFT_808837 [Zychaea mexicana]|uniref:uncharacterized protein n=1 Tax=Zychaea mexicana TaxID=64656 RepID=UPI0022FEBB0B|nr:uncharacterized protein BDB00DRAFT_808837 [Zychaea mexicana]KAI9496423.1 hypothetical protein BDB00DRAFT_808837 [Zychaea mexicana]